MNQYLRSFDDPFVLTKGPNNSATGAILSQSKIVLHLPMLMIAEL